MDGTRDVAAKGGGKGGGDTWATHGPDDGKTEEV